MKYDENKTYQAHENKKGEIVVGSGQSWLSGYTLNKLIEKNVVVKQGRNK